ncbi:MAG: hypothetical protein PHP86_18190 [Nevskiales bacterium]|nr:hypothetical protein [Nevskiales bacterium]
MEIDLYRDWVAHLSTELMAQGCDTSQMQSAETVVHAYFDLARHQIKALPRTPLKAKSFSCPDDLLPGLEWVEHKTRTGEDLSAHLDRTPGIPSPHDALLNDWGIHHVHLGAELDPDGFVARTDPVLFARFDDNNAYFISVQPLETCSRQHLIGQLHDNWPQSISHYRLSGILGLSMSRTDPNATAPQRCNVNTMIDLGHGVVYAPIGGGYTASGLSREVVSQADHCAHTLRKMQQSVIDNIDTIAAKAKDKGLPFPDNPRFELHVDNGTLYVVETTCMVAVPLGKL